MFAEDDESFVEEEEPRSDERYEYGRRSLFAVGWFRAALLLIGLAIVVTVTLPSLLDWFEPTPEPMKAPRTAAVAARAPASAPERSAKSADDISAKSTESALIPLPSAPTQSARVASAPAPARLAKAAAVVSGSERTTPRPSKANNAPSVAHGGRWVQVGLFKDRSNADGLARKLKAQGFSVEVAHEKRNASPEAGGLPAGTYHVVRVGVSHERAAVAARDDLKARGYAAFVAEAPTK